MKYTIEIIINEPREKVIEKLDNAENLKHWQEGLVDYEQISGNPGAEGSKMKLIYKMGKRDMVLTETILQNKLPEKLLATYETKGVYNIQESYFKEIDDKTTKWISKNEFQFSSFGMKLMGWIMPGAFKKQTKKYLTHFKNFVEQDRSVMKKDSN